MKYGPNKGKVCGKAHISKMHYGRPAGKSNSTSSGKEEDAKKDWLNKREADMTATGTRPKGPNKPDSRMTQDYTYNNDNPLATAWYKHIPGESNKEEEFNNRYSISI